MGCMCGKESITIGHKKYYIRSRLGEGGFSYVDLIEEIPSGRTLAVKRIMCHSEREGLIATNEVEVMKRISHPNLVPLVNFCVVPQRSSDPHEVTSEVFIVMPLYPRGSLQDKIDRMHKRSERMPENEIWRIFLAVCEGLNAMHSHSPPFVHRDIKPGNIMLDEANNPILMDMGSSTEANVHIKSIRQATALQDEASERCSMLFRPPELFTVESDIELDSRTDIWSLGCTLYAIAYLEAPFEKVYQSGGSIALAAMSGNLTFPQEAGYSTALQDMVSWLMTVNLTERPFIKDVISRVQTLNFDSSMRV